MDHGTTGISFAIMDERQVLDVFKISREDSKAGKVSAIEELSKRVDLDDIQKNHNADFATHRYFAENDKSGF